MLSREEQVRLVTKLEHETVDGAIRWSMDTESEFGPIEVEYRAEADGMRFSFVVLETNPKLKASLTVSDVDGAWSYTFWNPPEIESLLKTIGHRRPGFEKLKRFIGEVA